MQRRHERGDIRHLCHHGVQRQAFGKYGAALLGQDLVRWVYQRDREAGRYRQCDHVERLARPAEHYATVQAGRRVVRVTGAGRRLRGSR